MKLTVQQAAKRIGVCPSLVYGWVESRTITHYRIGGAGKRGRILIEEGDIDAFLLSRKVEPDISIKVVSVRRKPAKNALKYIKYE